jgi:hypothetical protein
MIKKPALLPQIDFEALARTVFKVNPDPRRRPKIALFRTEAGRDAFLKFAKHFKRHE